MRFYSIFMIQTYDEDWRNFKKNFYRAIKTFLKSKIEIDLDLKNYLATLRELDSNDISNSITNSFIS